MELGEKLSNRMKELGYNQSSLARATGLAQNSINQLVKGVRHKELSYRTVFLLKEALAVDDDFFSILVSQPRIERRPTAKKN